MGITDVPTDAVRVPLEGMADDPAGWTPIALKAPWVNVSGAGGANPQAAYRVGIDGRVYLRGWIRGATAINQPIWNAVPVAPPVYTGLEAPTMMIAPSTLAWKITTFNVAEGTVHHDVGIDGTPSGDIPDTLVLDGISWRPSNAPIGSAARALGAMPADASVLPSDLGASYGNLDSATVTPTAPRINPGGRFPPFGYERDAHGYVRLVGVVAYTGATPAYPFTLGVLPAPVRPVKKCAFSGMWVRVRNAGANDRRLVPGGRAARRHDPGGGRNASGGGRGWHLPVVGGDHVGERADPCDLRHDVESGGGALHGQRGDRRVDRGR